MGPPNKTLVEQQQQRSCSSSLNDMRLAKFLTDVVLVSSDGKEFPAHKSQLCAASSYFTNMFKSDMKEAASSRIEMKNITGAVMTRLLDVLYTNVIPDVDAGDEADMELVKGVMNAADYLQLTTLYEFYAELFFQPIYFEHFLVQWETAKEHNYGKYLDRILKSAAVNFLVFAYSKDFLELSVSQLKTVLAHPYLLISAREVVTEIIKWVEFKEDERSVELVGLLRMVNLERLDVESLRFLFKRGSGFDSNHEARKMITDRIVEKVVEDESAKYFYHFWANIVHVFSEDHLMIKTRLLNIQLPLDMNNFRQRVDCNGHMYVFVDGNSENGLTGTSVLYEYLTVANRMVKITRVKPLKKSTVTILHGLIYVLGLDASEGGERKDTPVFLRINPVTCEWEELAAPNSKLDRPDSDFELCIQIGCIRLSLGGSGVERYDVLRDQWYVIEAQFRVKFSRKNTYPYPTQSVDWTGEI